MEVLVPIVTGLLAGLCAHGLLGTGHRGRHGGGGSVPVATRALHAAGFWISHVDVPSRGVLSFALVGAGRRVERLAPGALAGTDRRRLEAGCLGLALCASSLVGGVLFWSWSGCVVGAAVPCAAIAWRWRSVRRAQADDLERALPDAFRSLAVALGSGLSMGQSMAFIVARSEGPVRAEFSRVALAIDCGIPVAEALDALVARADAPGLETVALALKVSQRTGAPLQGLLTQAAQMAQGRLELKRHLDVKTAQARMSARLVALMPVAMVCALSLISSDFRAGAASATGTACIAAAFALNALAWSIIRKIMEVRI